MHERQVFDLTHAFSTDFPVSPGGPQAERKTLVTVEENGYYIQRWNFAEHTGTHMDFPGRFIADGLLGIENVANLASIKDSHATVICGIPRYQEESGGPARILALTGM